MTCESPPLYRATIRLLLMFCLICFACEIENHPSLKAAPTGQTSTTMQVPNEAWNKIKAYPVQDAEKSSLWIVKASTTLLPVESGGNGSGLQFARFYVDEGGTAEKDGIVRMEVTLTGNGNAKFEFQPESIKPLKQMGNTIQFNLAPDQVARLSATGMGGEVPGLYLFNEIPRLSPFEKTGKRMPPIHYIEAPGPEVAAAAHAAQIQAEIDLCETNGGGSIVIGRGVHPIGSIFIKNNARILLEPGAVLRASEKLADFTPRDGHRAVVWFAGTEGAAVSGYGIIDGSLKGGHAFDPIQFNAVCMIGCKQTTLTNVLIRNSPSAPVYIEGGEHCTVDHIKTFPSFTQPRGKDVAVKDAAGTAITNLLRAERP